MGSAASNPQYTDAGGTDTNNGISNKRRKTEQLKRVNKNMNETSAVLMSVQVNETASNSLHNHLNVDTNSRNQITEENNAQSQEESRHRAEADKEREENIERERERIESVKARLEGKISKFCKQKDEISLCLLDKATQMFNTKLRTHDSSYQATLEENKYQQTQTKIANVQQERSRLMLRLSEAASVRLRHNNPHIADLSDGNRATKLAEKFSELYDNQWTDIFEATRKKAEKKVTDGEIAVCLRTILEVGYEKCREVYCEQRSRLLCELSMSRMTDLQTSSQAMSIRLKEFQRIVSQRSVQHVQQVVREHVNGQLNKELPVKHFSALKKDKKNPYYSYIDLCTDITWHMQVQDPPLVLDFGGSAEGETRFRPYTMSGPVLDYILWPAMLLHKGGPLVFKGVAQFKKKAEEQGNETVEKTNVTDSIWD